MPVTYCCTLCGLERQTFNYMMNQNEWLERATKYDLGKCIFYNRPIVIEARDQIDGSRRWVLKMDELVLGKDTDFHYEPMPSSRTDEFIENTRFNSPDECHSFWVENVNSEKPLDPNETATYTCPANIKAEEVEDSHDNYFGYNIRRVIRKLSK